MAETSNISRVANLVSEKIFKFFRWEQLRPNDENFTCCLQSEHFIPRKKRAKKSDAAAIDTGDESDHTEDDVADLEVDSVVESPADIAVVKKLTHPTDVCFKYYDPYLGKYVYLLTDLKSYAAGSIDTGVVRKALTSLVKSVGCARVSEQWQQRYDVKGKFEIHGLLFVYNHDNSFSKDFYNYFSLWDSQHTKSAKPIHTSSLKIKKSEKMLIADPSFIQKMLTIVNDIEHLRANHKFPMGMKSYRFFYPQKQKARVNLDANEELTPATFEMMVSAYFIVEHDAVKQICEDSGIAKEVKGTGYVVYYKEAGKTAQEFVYLLDALSSYNLLRQDYHIMVRCVSDEKDGSLMSNFKAAKDLYIKTWDLNSTSQEILNSIDFSRVPSVVMDFCSVDLGWEVR
ncbi:MAG: hypothetical protein VXW16_04695 [Bacteroidota bacterium]|nr:hypothetical protein [Bacteroidota bacterium]MEC8568911.1 hypothetical protein [Pseudomonadota bacterium]